MEEKEDFWEPVKTIVYIILFPLLCVFCVYMVIGHIKLLCNHSEVTAIVTKTSHTGGKGGHTVVYYEYEIDGRKLVGSTDLIMFHFFHNYYKGRQITIFVGADGDNHIKKELIPSLVQDGFFSLIFLGSFIVFFLAYFDKNAFKSNQPVLSGGAVVFYVQNNDHRIKNYDVRSVHIDEWLTKLENNEIVCFGFASGGDFREFSFSNGKYFLRLCQNGAEKETEFENRNEAETRMTREWRTAYFRA